LKLLVVFFIAGISLSSFGQTVEILKSQTFETGLRINQHRYGGISGLSYADGILWGISDDRGQFGPPRIYKHSLKDLSVKIENELLVKEPADSSVVDFEAIHRFKDGSFLISSEGDLDKKPRVMPFVRFWSEKDQWQMGLEFPDGFLPEKIGMQTKGLQNNFAFEGVAVNDDETSIFLVSEVPLYQNQNSELEFLQYDKVAKDWKFIQRKAYMRDHPPESSLEIVRGVSELLFWKKDYFLTLERYVRLSKKKAYVFGAELFSVHSTDMKKKKLFSLEGDLAGNWEGMAWGPDLSDGRKQLILVTDNNFEKRTPTRFLFLSFKEEK
jgi:3-phytase